MATTAVATAPALNVGCSVGGAGGGSSSASNDYILKLHSPAGAEPITFKWPITNGIGKVIIAKAKMEYLEMPISNILWLMQYLFIYLFNSIDRKEEAKLLKL